jgi:ABC-type lipoprotein release transport system permease subunit
MIGKLAFRNLFRNKWRSALTAGGVAAAVVVLVWMNAFVDGMLGQMVRGATALETGQVQFQTRAYADEGRIWHAFPAGDELYQRIEAVEGVDSVAPRVNFSGLAGNDERSKVARFVGLDARRSGHVGRSVVEGRWLDESSADGGPREAVVGVDFARQIGLEVGDELVALVSAQDGSLGNDLFEVVGIVEAGNNAIDQRTVFLNLGDAQFLAALEGQVHRLVVRTSRVREAQSMADRLDSVGDWWTENGMAETTSFVDGEERPAELVVRSWQEMMPTLADYLELSRSSMWFMYLVLYFLAALGILNTQRMSALDREREFGVMQAIGMSPPKVFAVVLWETTLLTLIGALVGAAIGVGLNAYFAEFGLNLGAFLEQETFTFMGVVVSMRIPFSVSFWGTVTPILAILPVALLCGLWPAYTSASLEPAKAISKKD